tara:strand:- start:95 stop:346 length:252 start_codon:yes stop_codon:yes gene_type:complete
MQHLKPDALEYLSQYLNRMDENSTTKHEKRRDALGLFYESVLKPDHELRQCAHNQECYHELMEWRNDVLNYLDERRNYEFFEN